ncbi:MAG TPA: secondary thiamine-phosphate synthase enzyme YjbQ [Methanospirillum sp.]|uniref:secondary thiamine-phosphate synthase enzyme YjbQ n=1 Tax=Methanospirillum sp. TaxID=45200 RepID=UPI002CEBF8CD|nr:secondary thiamine-phosphate synthase enzyme YjbQ [Methanospirillum sp.]HOJ95756.1 secondary thiamine-phosphate synthase enzyme YjbQ [Methanospirillum sp.]HOL40777.1 secondary thiamine-phosphate synthase enzyme YjbQ [Methanospirillum sp.]HPP79000.1 secondary thiamine-phosphate synthase enzyme YjbQ [Methanospirillum sp.]
MTASADITLATKGEGDIVDITDKVQEIARSSGVQTGICHVFVTGSTAAVTTIEYEPGVLRDLSRALSVCAPSDITYAHDSRWGDGNGRSHVKAALVGPSLTVPVRNSSVVLGTWQQIVVLELDTRPRRDRHLVVTILGE